MADVDDETVERVMHWCAEAGRHAGAQEIRAALAPLGWDELLNVRAVLADPPPGRPLGPQALVDLARGTPADVVAEREREGRYRAEADEASAAVDPSPAPSPRPRSRRAGPRHPAPPVVHRKRDVAAAEAPASPPLPPLDELRLPAGRAVIEQLIRKHGARRSFLLAALADWRRADGGAPDDGDLTALVDLHGLANAFAHRERDELLHALRAARGERAGAATALGLSPEGFQAALERLGAADDAERIREERRAELRARATLAERCALLANEEPRLADLGLLQEIESDLRARLPEHLRALRAGGLHQALGPAFAVSVALPDKQADALIARFGIVLEPAAASRHPGQSRGRPRSRGERPQSRERRPRSGGQRPQSRERRPQSGERRPQSGGQRPQSGERRPQSGGQRSPRPPVRDQRRPAGRPGKPLRRGTGPRPPGRRKP